MITYQIETDFSVEEFKDILVRSTLSERRPVEDAERMGKMVVKCNLIVSARHEGYLVGISRSISDFAFCTYLSDLAVDKNYQMQGIGKELIRQTKLAAPQALLILHLLPLTIIQELEWSDLSTATYSGMLFPGMNPRY